MTTASNGGSGNECSRLETAPWLGCTHRFVALVLALGSTTLPTSAATAPTQATHRKATESEAVAHATSPALGSMSPAASASGQRQVPNLEIPPPQPGHPAVAPGALQGPSRARASGSTAPAATRNSAGLGEGFVGPQGTFNMRTMPPDPNGDVGPNHYVQIVNLSLAVFDKAGTVLYGPVPNNTLWTGFGGLCEQHNDGDPIVVYDGLADRWVISQFAIQSHGPNFECIAVSTTSDPLGTYALYAYSYEHFNDYPKIALWPDAYYATYNMYEYIGGDFIGTKTCALVRSRMLANLPANQQCVDFDGIGFLPSDLDGTTPPPVGSPNYLLGGKPDDLEPTGHVPVPR